MSTTSIDLRPIRRQGLRAYKAGKSISDNPYLLDARRWNSRSQHSPQNRIYFAWQDGWLDGEVLDATEDEGGR